MRRLLGLRELVHDAIDEITNLVEETHEGVARKVMEQTPVALLSLSEPVGRVVRGVEDVRHAVSGAVFDGVRAANRSVRTLSGPGVMLTAAVLEHFVERSRGSVSNQVDAWQTLESWADRADSALNGVIGDFLEARGNSLATPMSLRRGGVTMPLKRSELSQALPAATGKLCIFVHGLGCSDAVWHPALRVAVPERAPLDATPEQAPLDFAAELERTRGYTCFDLRYNSGLKIGENGYALALLLRELAHEYPQPIDQIALVGHSMGGLVVRSAAHYAEQRAEPWLGKLSHVFSIGSPHQGAPLARAGHVLSSVLALFDTAATQVSAKVLQARSAGIKDLAFGTVLRQVLEGAAEADMLGTQHPCPFVPGVSYGYVAARFHISAPGPLREWLGDQLVDVPSASGRHRDPARHLSFHMGHVIEGVHHVALTTHPDVYCQLERFLGRRWLTVVEDS